MIILRLFPGLLTNGVADIAELPLDKANAENSSQEERNECVNGRTSPKEVGVHLLRAYDQRIWSVICLYDTPNPYRSSFYTDVTNAGEKLNFLPFPIFVRMVVFSSLWKGAYHMAILTHTFHPHLRLSFPCLSSPHPTTPS